MPVWPPGVRFGSIFRVRVAYHILKRPSSSSYMTLSGRVLLPSQGASSVRTGLLSAFTAGFSTCRRFVMLSMR